MRHKIIFRIIGTVAYLIIGFSIVNAEDKTRLSGQTIYMDKYISDYFMNPNWGKAFGTRVNMSNDYISRFPTNPWVDVAGDITMKGVGIAYQWKASSPAYDIASSVMGAGITFMQTIDRIGKSMQIMNPPIYLQNNLERGQIAKFTPSQKILGIIPVSGTWEGAGSYPIPGGNAYYQETLITGGPNIIQKHTNWRTTNLGTDYRHVEIKTPVSNGFERFMVTQFPVNSYFDPKTSVMTYTRSFSGSWRETTVGGVTSISPVVPSYTSDVWNKWGQQQLDAQKRFGQWLNNPIGSPLSDIGRWNTGVGISSYGVGKGNFPSLPNTMNYPPPNILFSTKYPLSTYTPKWNQTIKIPTCKTTCLPSGLGGNQCFTTCY